MKKSIAILALVFAATTSFAQYNNRSQKSNNYPPNHNYGVYNNGNYANQKAVEIARINREYYYTIQRIESNRFVSHRQKRMMIREAEQRRDQQIQICNSRFNGYNNQARRYDNNYDRRFDNDRNRRDDNDHDRDDHRNDRRYNK